MNLLAPLFLAGAAAIAAPILFHLIRRTTRDQRPFSSLMFLQPSPPHLSRRRRLEHVVLLLLRCAALALLALGFARPFFVTSDVPAAPAESLRRVLLLVDTSASMRRAGLWDDARAAVAAQVRSRSPGDAFALYAFDDQTRALLSFDEWGRTPTGERAAVIEARMDALSPGWGATQLGDALRTAAAALRELPAGGPAARSEIVLISDLQAGSRLNGLQGTEWPKGVELVVKPVKSRHPTNAGLQVLDPGADARTAARRVRVRVTNSATSRREQFELVWSSGAQPAADPPPVQAYVPPGQSRVFSLTNPATAGARLVLRGDDEPFDNTANVIATPPQRVAVLWIGTPPGNDVRSPFAFLRRAYSDTSRIDVRITTAAPGALSPNAAAAADLVFVAGDVSAAEAAALRNIVRGGKTLVVVPQHDSRGTWLGDLLATGGVALAETVPANYAMFATIDFRHPLFAPFADPRFSDFTKIHVWRFRRIDASAIPGAHVVASFDSGDPAVLDVPVGRGRVLILATSWQPDDSQLAVSSKFVPMMWSLLDLTGAVTAAPASYTVGAPVPLPPRGATAVRLPTGRSVALTADARTFDATTEPGVYVFTGGAADSPFAVNIDASESRTAPLSLDELEQLGVPLHPEHADAAAAAAIAAAHAADLENRQKLWRWLIAAALVLLVGESLLAGWIARTATTRQFS